jgi:hypothetical protein
MVKGTTEGVAVCLPLPSGFAGLRDWVLPVAGPELEPELALVGGPDGGPDPEGNAGLGGVLEGAAGLAIFFLGDGLGDELVPSSLGARGNSFSMRSIVIAWFENGSLGKEKVALKSWVLEKARGNKD